MQSNDDYACAVGAKDMVFIRKTTDFRSLRVNSAVFFCFAYKGYDIGYVAIKNITKNIYGMR